MSKSKEMDEKKFIKKGDIVLIFSIVLIAGIIGFFFLLQGKNVGKFVRVMVDGAVYGEYSLYEDREVVLQTEWGENCFEIKNGVVRMYSADCPDKYCVKHAAINTEKDPIVCLPHRVVVEIVTE